MDGLPSLAAVVVGGHFVLLAALASFGAHRLFLVGLRCRIRPAPAAPGSFAGWPAITVQVPLYNERLVARRVVDAVAAFDYPADRLEIQILDDSTDDTVEIVAERVRFHRSRGFDIVHRRRGHRYGYKAGALAEGLREARGEFVAIFDADFVPHRTLLREAVVHLADPDVGLVQLRWDHLNRDASRLTKVQAIRLDAHFAIEQSARAAVGYAFNFNGTAGIWRTKAIHDAGGWQADTLTEDLDLSYRAQLRGWRFVYLPSLGCPGELPTDLAALETQQHRWAKGATQVLLKLFAQVWRSSRPVSWKVEATFHLAGNLAYLAMMLDAVVFLVPSLLARHAFGWHSLLWLDVVMLILSSGGQICFFVAGQWFSRRPVGRSLRLVPALLAHGVGFATNGALAAVEALRGQQTAFVRTPKAGPLRLAQGGYRAGAMRKRGPELAIGLGYGVAAVWAAVAEIWVAVPFLVLLHVGFLSNSLSALRAERIDARVHAP